MSIKAIHTLKGKLHLSDAEYRALLMREAGVSSSSDLTAEGDKAVMAALRSMEAERTVPYLLGICGRVVGYRIPGTDTLPRLNGQEKYKIIEALKARLKQEEWSFSQKTGVPF